MTVVVPKAPALDDAARRVLWRAVELGWLSKRVVKRVLRDPPVSVELGDAATARDYLLAVCDRETVDAIERDQAAPGGLLPWRRALEEAPNLAVYAIPAERLLDDSDRVREPYFLERVSRELVRQLVHEDSGAVLSLLAKRPQHPLTLPVLEAALSSPEAEDLFRLVGDHLSEEVIGCLTFALFDSAPMVAIPQVVSLCRQLQDPGLLVLQAGFSSRGSISFDVARIFAPLYQGALTRDAEHAAQLVPLGFELEELLGERQDTLAQGLRDRIAWTRRMVRSALLAARARGDADAVSEFLWRAPELAAAALQDICVSWEREPNDEDELEARRLITVLHYARPSVAAPALAATAKAGLLTEACKRGLEVHEKATAQAPIMGNFTPAEAFAVDDDEVGTWTADTIIELTHPKSFEDSDQFFGGSPGLMPMFDAFDETSSHSGAY